MSLLGTFGAKHPYFTGGQGEHGERDSV
jgi:hypothetical protein